MNRTELINYLLQQRHGTSYLEIGVGNRQENFAHVRCEHKVGVEPKPGVIFQGTSDEFFAYRQRTFDVIFIDGLHTEEQVLRDIANAYRCLAPGGVIVLHDCMPPDAWHQRGPEAFREGENWTGTVWKAALREFNRAQYRCTLLDMDWGCGVIDTAQSQVPRCRELPAELDYEQHYAWLLEYKVSVAAYLRRQVRVFYHLACMGNWRQVFTEQLAQLQQHGFHTIDLTVLGMPENMQTAQTICAEAHIDAQIIFHAPELTHFEKPALQAIEAYARHHEAFVLYLHSKGVSNPADATKAKWRRLMMRELIENWEQCVVQLPYYDAIGVNWRDLPPISHFSGNFWYASTRYLRTLADFAHYYDNPHYQIWDAINDKRLGCEFWIGSSHAPPHVLSLLCRNVDFCTDTFWKNY
jgi:SAM-dependent methyltransferase